MRIQVFAVAASLVLCAPASMAHANSSSQSARHTASSLAGAWKSMPDQLRLSSDFDQSVWGPNASSVRTVELAIRDSGEGRLTVTRKVVDARGRTISASTSVEDAQLLIGAPQKSIAGRIDHDVMVLSAERRYPDDPSYKWPIDGLAVRITTFEDGDGNTLELRFDPPEGRGAFWETLRRR